MNGLRFILLVFLLLAVFVGCWLMIVDLKDGVFI